MNLPGGTRQGRNRDAEKTRKEFQHALREVRQAVEPPKSRARGALSWLVALGAGAAVLKRTAEQIGAARARGENEAAAPIPLPEAEHRRREAAEDRAQAEIAAAKRELRATPTGAAPEAETSEKEAASEAKPAPGETVHGPAALAKEFLRRFKEDEVMTRAAALAFAGIFSLLPLLLIALAALGFFIRDPQQAGEYVQRVVAQLLPGSQATEAARNVIRETGVIEGAQGLIQGRIWAVVVGIASLLFTATSLFVAASVPMNTAWDVKETRNMLQLRLTALGVFLGAGLLFLLSLVPSSGADFLRNLNISWLSLPDPVPWWVGTLFWLVALVINAGMFVLIYRFLPNAPVTWKAALFGGAIAAVFWELFKRGFSLYLAHFGNFNKLYGTLGGVALLVTWIYYSCIVLLAGAILCKMYQEQRQEGGVAARR